MSGSGLDYTELSTAYKTRGLLITGQSRKSTNKTRNNGNHRKQGGRKTSANHIYRKAAAGTRQSMRRLNSQDRAVASHRTLGSQG